MTFEKAYFGAGCFWGVEEVFRTLEGVSKTTVGYQGGKTSNPTYQEVCSKMTNHAEVVEVEFDASIISYETLLDHFWKCHNPTLVNRQGPDVGTQYRTIIFTTNESQKEKALKSKKELEQSKKFDSPIATTIEDYKTFYPAEEYHQQYFFKRGGGTCHI